MSTNRIRTLFLAAGVFAAAKFKWILALLKWSKFGGTLLSMALSLGGYAVVYGWKFGAALVYLIFIHEMGHVLAAKRKGISTSPAIFIPFVGAFIGMKDQPRNASTEANLAYGGPLAGLLSFLPAVPLYLLTGEPFWGLVIFMGAALNLFNLLPVSPLDGGRIVAVLSTRIWLLGLLLLSVLVTLAPGPLPILLLVIGCLTWWSRVREGYRRSVLLYEREVLAGYQADLHQAKISLTDPAGLQGAGTAAAVETSASRVTEASPSRRRWFIPFLHDKEKLMRDRKRIEDQYAEKARGLWQVLQSAPSVPGSGGLHGDAGQPVASPEPLLDRSIEEAEQRMNKVEGELQRIRTYYNSTASVKWKVLAAYLALTLVLMLFSFYGFYLMELHQIKLK
ncbi:site-2 protease family protein [Paenibacillus sp. S-38]|uniref:site-2 protease family protein n=1 Tax=Paenibacillus sp. S-38 TaxID=3416710 RepID=UPI003CFA8736